MEKTTIAQTSTDFTNAINHPWFKEYGTEEMVELMLNPIQDPEEEIRNLNDLAWCLVGMPGPVLNVYHTTPAGRNAADREWAFFYNGRYAFEEFLRGAAAKFSPEMVEAVLDDPDRGWGGASIWEGPYTP